MTTPKKRVVRVAGAVVSVAALTVLTSVAAAGSASAADSRCGSNSICLFQNTNFTGEVWEFPLSQGNACDFRPLVAGGGKSIDNRASSMINNTGRYVNLYVGYGCKGDAYVAKPHSVDSTFSNNTVNGGNFNDRASGLSYGK